MNGRSEATTPPMLNANVRDYPGDLVPETREKFYSLTGKYYKLITDTLFINNKPVWYSPKEIIQKCALKDLINHFKNLHDPLEISSLEQRINKLFSSGTPSKLGLFRFLREELCELHLDATNFFEKIPFLAKLLSEGLIPEYYHNFNSDLLLDYLVIWKIFQMPEENSEISSKFSSEFENYIINTFINEKGEKLNSLTELRDCFLNSKHNSSFISLQKPRGFLNFFTGIQGQILYFFSKWYAIKDLPLDEYLFMKRLNGEHSPEEKENRTEIEGIIFSINLYHSKRKSPFHKCWVNIYNVYILSTGGEVFCTRVTLPVERKNRTEKKKKVFNQEDLRYKGLGTRVRLTGRTGYKSYTPVEIYWKNKVFEMNTCELTHVRYLDID